VVRQALKIAQLAPEAVGYVETHGTGTVLGDPIEVGALVNVLRPGGGAGNPLVLGAVKTNIGHLEAASGIAGLIKAVLSLDNGIIPANLHLESLNPHLADHAQDIVAPTEARPWPRAERPRVAGVSAFGFGGTNAHVVVAEAPAPAAAAAAPGPAVMLFPVSARSEDALRRSAEAMIAFLESAKGQALAPADLAHTAGSRRPHYDHRLCAVGADAAEWASSLRTQMDTIGGDRAPRGTSPDDGDEHRSTLSDMARLYVEGGALDWTQLSPAAGRCVPLPRHPWRRQRYWLSSKPGADGPAVAAAESGQRADAPADWFYALNWRPRTSLGGERLLDSALGGVDTGRFTDDLRARAQAPTAGDTNAAIPRKLLDDRAVFYIWSALGELGAQVSPGAAWPKDGLRHALGIQPRFERLLGRMTGILRDAGILRDQGRTWVVAAPPAAKIDSAEPSAMAGIGEVLDLQARCGPSLASVLRGETEPLSLLFAGDGGASAEAIYQDAAPSRRGNETLAEAVRAWMARVPADRILRVLEIGAGTGATTAVLLPMLPRDRCEYVFTDVSPAFLRRGAQRFAGDGRFDLVVAANVVHATHDLGRSLAHIRELLADGGILALLECTTSRPWMDISFGLTEGWWRFTDLGLREDHPLLSQSAWTALLGRSGFGDVSALSLQGAEGDPIFDQSLIVARKPIGIRRRDAAPTVMGGGADVGRYIIFDDDSGLGDAVVEALRDQGTDTVLIAARSIADAPDLTGPRPEGVIYLAARRDGDLAGACERPLGVIRSLIRQAIVPRKGVWLVTQGGQPPGDIQVSALGQSMVWGFGRGVALEAPELQPTLIDLDPATDASTAARALIDEIAHPDGEDQIVLRGAGRYVPRLERIEPSPSGTAPLRVSGCHLITGGLGGLGSLLALELARAGASELVLVVNRALPDRADWAALPVGGEAFDRVRTVQALEALGVGVHVVALDLTDPESLPALFRTEAITGAPLRGAPLRGFWHAATTFSEHPLAELDESAVRSMIQVKAGAALTLHELTRDRALDQFVLFSSTTGLWGARGLAHYAAANACLDALAHVRRSRGLAATVIDWGVWAAARGLSAAQRAQAGEVGLRPMEASSAFAALGQVLASGATQTIVADVDWSRFKPVYEARRARPMLSGLGGGAPAQVPRQQPPADGETPLDRLMAAAPEQRGEMMRSVVRRRLAEVLGLDPEAFLDPRTGFFDLGMDSLTSIQLRRRLEQALARPLPSTLAFKYPTIEALASYLLEVLSPDSGPSEGPVVLQADPPAAVPVIPAGDEDMLDDDEATEDELFERLAARLSAPRFSGEQPSRERPSRERA
jgi:NAD(P)-dependent dehydrogenase (short-subunit alcohol dehydrogenase family)/acyl carrier protein/SAM-dependent methyltransferase